jgi:hypothetical protein
LYPHLGHVRAVISPTPESLSNLISYLVCCEVCVLSMCLPYVEMRNHVTMFLFDSYDVRAAIMTQGQGRI